MRTPVLTFLALTFVTAVAAVAVVTTDARAQSAVSSRLSILLAEERGALTANDLALLRRAAHDGDSDTAKIAIRALGRLDRPSLLADLLPALRFELPELRAAAADAIGSSLAGSKPGAAAVSSVLSTLTARLNVEGDPGVRAAICETIGRLPYADANQVAEGERALLDMAGRSRTGVDRLGVAKGFELLVRINLARRQPSASAVDALNTLFKVDPLRDPRVRRLALEALITADKTDDDLIERAVADTDLQVRRLAMRAVAGASHKSDSSVAEVLRQGFRDPAPMVRIEALRAEGGRARGSVDGCALEVGAAADSDVHVQLAAIDELAACAGSPEAIALLERTVDDLSDVNAPRGWHATAHALVALAGAAPDRASAKLGQFAGSSLWPLRRYAARAAAVLGSHATLEMLAKDSNDAIAEEANDALLDLAGERPVAPDKASRKMPPPTALNAADLRRLAAARARVTVHGVGSFELALFTSEAPATVLRFARLAESGHYNGLTIDRVLPNVVVQTRNTAHAPVAAATFARDEAGAWPHVRGTVGLSSQAGDGRDGQIFIDLVDNPSFDHRYTVFAQVLNGLDIVDDLLEGDVIDRIEILP